MKSRTQQQLKIDNKRFIEIKNLLPDALCQQTVKRFFDNTGTPLGNSEVDLYFKKWEPVNIKTECARMWINLLSRIHHEKGEVPIRLNPQLLPEVSPAVLYGKQYADWYAYLERDEGFIHGYAIRREDVRPLFDAFIKNVKNSFSDGQFILLDGLKIMTDENGYYLLK